MYKTCILDTRSGPEEYDIIFIPCFLVSLLDLDRSVSPLFISEN